MGGTGRRVVRRKAKDGSSPDTRRDTEARASSATRAPDPFTPIANARMVSEARARERFLEQQRARTKFEAKTRAAAWARVRAAEIRIERLRRDIEQTESALRAYNEELRRALNELDAARAELL